MAVLILVDLLLRSRDLVAHYTDAGVLPRIALLDQAKSRWLISLHLINGTWEIQAILFVIAGAFAVALLVGYKTRLATIVSWILLASLDSRNLVVLDGGDTMLRVLLFWAIFLPWGSRWSIDSALNPPPEGAPDQITSCGTFAYIMQVVFVYWFTVLYKTGPEWHADGTALYYTLNVDKMVTPIGEYFLQFPGLLKPLTHMVFWFEVIGPLLLFSPVFTGPVRTLTIAGFALFHLGIGSSMKIGIFPYIGTLSMLGFLPAWFWEKIGEASKTKDGLGLRIYYDQDCGFCARSVRLIKTFFLLPKVELFPSTIDPSIERDMSLHNSWVLLDAKENRYFGFRGVIAVLERSPLLWPLASLLRFGWIAAVGERLYSWAAIHRRVTCALPISSSSGQTTLKLSSIEKFFVLFLLVYVFFWNLATLPNTGIKISERPRSIGYALRLDQTWNMFAPYPLKDDGWYVIPGRLKDGEVVDLNHDGAPVTLDRPVSILQTYKNYRWRKYLDNLLSESIKSYRVYYAEYLCRVWNASHSGSEVLEELDIIYMLEWTLPNYEHPVPRPVRLLTHRCEASAK